MIFSDDFIQIIRKAIRQLVIEKQEMPTSDKRLEISRIGDGSEEASDIPQTFSRTILYRFMKQNCFIFSPCKRNYEGTKEREDIVQIVSKTVFL